MQTLDKANYTGAKYSKHRTYWDNVNSSFDDRFVFAVGSEQGIEQAYTYTQEEFSLPEGVSNNIRSLTKEDPANILAVMISAFSYIIHYYTGRVNISVNVPSLKELTTDYNSTGFFFVNRSWTIQDYLNAVKREIRNRYLYCDYPYYLFQENKRFTSNVLIGNKDLHTSPLVGNDKYDLEVFTYLQDNRLCVSCRYSQRFTQFIVKRLMDHLTSLLSQYNDLNYLIKNLRVLPQKELQELEKLSISHINFPVPELTLADLFESHVQECPDSVFLRYKDSHYTYDQVNRLANRIANYLISEAKVSSNSVVALLTKRSEYQIIALLGILKSGAILLPLDSNFPVDRLQFMITDTCVHTLITQLDFIFDFLESDISIFSVDAQLSDFEKEEPVTRNSLPDDVAYQIYTSGSTGKPKAVAISNKSLVNYLQWLKIVHNINNSDRTLLFSSIGFDLGYTSLFSAIAYGAKLTILEDTPYFNSIEFLLCMQEEKITYLKITPSHLHLLLDQPLNLESSFHYLRLVILGGEPLRYDDLEKFKKFNSKTKLINHYGPTETTIGALTSEIDQQLINQQNRIQLIGRPIANTRVVIANSDLEILPTEIEGEILISGNGLGKGYANDSALTSEKYITLNDGGLYYRTGDLGEQLSNGSIVFLGRIDNQIKLNGYRIELEEIKHVMMEVDGVNDAVVQVVKMNNQSVLTAYYTSEEKFSSNVIREYLHSKLPHYMIPLHFTELEEIPLNKNGKVDYKALIPIDIGTNEIQEPRTEREILVFSIWKEVLNNPHISTTANFFEEGGDSIKAIQIASRLYNQGYKADVKDIFEFPTIEQLALKIDLVKRVADQNRIEGEIPLTPIQEEFFINKRSKIHHFNQAVTLTLKSRIDVSTLEEMMNIILSHHDALRIYFDISNNGIIQYNLKDCTINVEEYVFSYNNENNESEYVKAIGVQLQKKIRLGQPPLIKCAQVHLPECDKVIIVAHHLIVDTISWRIILEDILSLFDQRMRHQDYRLPIKTDSFKLWAERIVDFSEEEELSRQSSYWNKFLQKENVNTYYSDRICNLEQLSFELERASTEALLFSVHKSFSTEVNDILLAALFLSISRGLKIADPVVYIESHGRVDDFQSLNIGRTVGWFTSIYPVTFNTNDCHSLREITVGVKEVLRRVPELGIGYCILKYKSSDELRPTRIKFKFNYFGQVDSFLDNDFFTLTDDDIGETSDPNDVNYVDFNISGVTNDNILKMSLKYNPYCSNYDEIKRWWRNYQQSLEEIITFCSTKEKGELTPSDFTYKKLSQEEVNNLFDND